jgi:hypothetical protein
MWALEYDPSMFLMYEEAQSASENPEGFRGKAKSTRQCGKFERQNMRNGAKNAESPLPISVFLVASVLKDKSTKLLDEARGLDDVVKVSHVTSNSIELDVAIIEIQCYFIYFIITFVFKT